MKNLRFQGHEIAWREFYWNKSNLHICTRVHLGRMIKCRLSPKWSWNSVVVSVFGHKTLPNPWTQRKNSPPFFAVVLIAKWNPNKGRTQVQPETATNNDQSSARHWIESRPENLVVSCCQNDESAKAGWSTEKRKQRQVIGEIVSERGEMSSSFDYLVDDGPGCVSRWNSFCSPQ